MKAVLAIFLLQDARGTHSASWRPLWQRVADSGRVVEQGVGESERVAPARRIAPGPPPLLQFRYLEGKLRHGYSGTSLVLDDAGH